MKRSSAASGASRGQHGGGVRPLQRQQRPVGELGDADRRLQRRAQMREVGVAAAGIDDQEQMVAGVADDQVVEDAARRRW